MITNCAHLKLRGAKRIISQALFSFYLHFPTKLLQYILIDDFIGSSDHLRMMNLQTEKQNYAWVENLAIEEINMEDSGFVTFTESLAPTRLLEESSIEFVNKVKDRFEFYVALFNQYRVNRDQGRAIKVFRISNTVNDFMLFRNTLKLIVSRRSPDLITIGFLSTHGGLFSSRPSGDPSPMTTTMHELKAHVGPFDQVTWRYQGELVEVEAIVRFYLTEFIRHSAR